VQPGLQKVKRYQPSSDASPLENKCHTPSSPYTATAGRSGRVCKTPGNFLPHQLRTSCTLYSSRLQPARFLTQGQDLVPLGCAPSHARTQPGRSRHAAQTPFVLWPVVLARGCVETTRNKREGVILAASRVFYLSILALANRMTSRKLRAKPSGMTAVQRARVHVCTSGPTRFLRSSSHSTWTARNKTSGGLSPTTRACYPSR